MNSKSLKQLKCILSWYWKLKVPNQSYCTETAVLTGLHSRRPPPPLCSGCREDSFPCLFQFLVAAISPRLLTCSVTKSRVTLCNPMDCSTPGFPVLHCLPEFAQTHVRWVSDAMQPSHPLSSTSLTTSLQFLLLWSHCILFFCLCQIFLDIL